MGKWHSQLNEFLCLQQYGALYEFIVKYVSSMISLRVEMSINVYS